MKTTSNKSNQITEDKVFNLQSGTKHGKLPKKRQHFFDITGYFILKDLLTCKQVNNAKNSLDKVNHSAHSQIQIEQLNPQELTLFNIIEVGGAVEDAMANKRLVRYIQPLIWGTQYRLVSSQGKIRKPASNDEQLSQGGQADTRRFTGYRCGPGGEFRSLLITVLIALSDTSSEEGCLCLIPGSHKSNLPHPYINKDLDDIPPLYKLPLTAGSAVIFTENISHAMKSPKEQTHHWLKFQYGPSYFVNFPKCTPSQSLLKRTANDPVKSHLLLPSYYHPEGSQ